ncbi:MAG: family N-acetyltransferase [Bacteroidetes bacterium]|jgi:GNAT superfamily N-acetyltransferase|nr:family N-acetyltransferase [Bacteroidota bacterium]
MLQISPVNESNIVDALELIRSLLIELGDEAEDAVHIDKFILNKERLLNQAGHYMFVAKLDSEIVGVITISECFAIYAGGLYGTINEMYVKPAYRSQNVGKQLIDEAKALAVKNKWARIDVTAPIEERWLRTINFYEDHGFGFTGEKLKFKTKE